MKYEIEVKSLISRSDVEGFVQKIRDRHPSTKEVEPTSQLNHYFQGGDIQDFCESFFKFVPVEQRLLFKTVCVNASNQSVRTREIDGKGSLLIIKASTNKESSANGSTRIEFEAPLSFSIDELDSMLLEAGFEYQAKWSRDRREFIAGSFNICLDKNAGYGWLVEIEKLTDDEAKLDAIRQEVAEELTAYGLQELPSDRLERMFSFYSANWQEYYGTSKTFEVA